jgi:hypothetical protein
MPIILDQALYNRVKREADKVYTKPSAYKSGWIVKHYKDEGGRYADDNQTKNLARWFKEDWRDIGGQDYPVYRPHKRISKDTPLTADEIDPEQANEQIALKQEIKGEHNLPPFKGKGVDLNAYLIPKVPKTNEIWKWSNPIEVRKQADTYLGKDIPIYISTSPKKKYMVQDPHGKWVHFGQLSYEDYTKHRDDKRRHNYLTRTANIRGNWKDNKYSANNLSRNILW